MKDFIRYMLSLILPPAGVFLQIGLGTHFWLNVVLTLFGYLPGLIHAAYVIATVDDEETNVPPGP